MPVNPGTTCAALAESNTTDRAPAAAGAANVKSNCFIGIG